MSVRRLAVLATVSVLLGLAAVPAAEAGTVFKDSKVTGKWVVGTRPGPDNYCIWAAFLVFKRPDIKPPKLSRGYRIKRRLDKLMSAEGGYTYFGERQTSAGNFPFLNSEYAKFVPYGLPPLPKGTYANLGNQGSGPDCTEDVEEQNAQLGGQRVKVEVTQFWKIVKKKKNKKKRR